MRWFILSLLFAATAINYLDRQILGLLKPTLESEFQWSEKDYSHVVMAFTSAYAIGLLFFGRFIDHLGTKLGYGLAGVVWSIAAMAHAAAGSTLGFGIARAVLGLGEAGNFPAAIKAIAEWFPRQERALSAGILNAGTTIGGILVPVLVPLILVWAGWQTAFLITGALGFVWLVFWIKYYGIPSQKKNLSAQELAYIQSDAAPDISTGSVIPYRRLFFYRQTWAFVVGKFLTDPIWWFFLFWIPSYFASVFHLNLAKPSLELVIVYGTTTLGSIAGGYLSGYLIQRGWPLFKARKSAMFLFAVLVVPIFLVQFTSNIWVAVALIALAAAAHQAWSATIFTTVSDMFPRRSVSSVVGIGGMAGSVAGILFPLLIGYLLDAYKATDSLSHGYHLIFSWCSSAYLLAWIIIHFLVPRMEKVSID